MSEENVEEPITSARNISHEAHRTGSRVFEDESDEEFAIPSNRWQWQDSST